MSLLKRNLKEVVYGGSDGIVTTFAVVAGYAGSGGLGMVENTYWIVVLFGFANLLADAASMGLGDFLSSRSQRDVVQGTMRDIDVRIDQDGQQLVAETQRYLEKEALSTADQETMLQVFSRNKELWKDFLLTYMYQYSRDEADHPLASALTTFFSFIVFGVIPLLPFVFLHGELPLMFLYSLVATMTAMVLLGLLRYKVSEMGLVRSVAEALGIGSIAAVIAYGVGVVLG